MARIVTTVYHAQQILAIKQLESAIMLPITLNAMTTMLAPSIDAHQQDAHTLQSFATMEMHAPTIFATPELENVLLLLVL
jgi:hypothetical protein